MGWCALCTMKTRMNCREIHNTMYGEIGSELHIIEIEGKGSYCHAILRVFSPFSMIMFCQRALVLFDQFRLDRALASQPGPSQLIELTINRPITTINHYHLWPRLMAGLDINDFM